MAEASGSTSTSKDSSSMGLGMKATLKMIRLKFSKVKDITTETLDGWLHGGTDSQNIVLMDCRDECEYAVSHIAGAKCVDWENGDPQHLLDNISAEKPCTVVCYCSVGYRSSALADRLQKFLQSSKIDAAAQDTQKIQVFNLEGSLFKWANEGRTMVDSAGQPTIRCHPYKPVWGKLLNEDLRCYDASSGQ